MKFLKIGGVVALFVCVFVIYGASFQKKDGVINTARDNLSSKGETYTGEFKDLTIPYLRSLKYNSTFSDMSEVSENPEYESFLTSYDSDGFRINALLTMPTGKMPEGGFPAIIFIHGYIPPESYQTLLRYEDYVDYLARSGYVVLKIDLREHGNSEGEASGAYYSGDYIIDVLNARAALKNANFINSEKIGIWGHSMAGNITLRSLAADPEIPVAVIWAGAVYTYDDWEKYGLGDRSYRPPSDDSERSRRRKRLFDMFGEFDNSHQFWKLVPATNYLKDIKSAIQIHHAVDDDVVNIGYSRELNQLLDQTRIVHELHEYPSGGHNISGSAFNQAMQSTVSFFDRFLK